LAALVLAATVALSGNALAQDKDAKKDAKPASTKGYSTLDISPFVGWNWFQFGQGNNAANHRFSDAFNFGGRVNENFHQYLSLEEGVQEGFNGLRLVPVGGSQFTNFKASNTLAYAAGVVNFAPRDAKYRPFALVGPGYIWYRPGTGQFTGLNPKSDGRTALVYGLGLLVNSTPKWGVRFDLRGMRSGTPSMNLPVDPGAAGTFYLANHKNHESALGASIGLVIRARYVDETPKPDPAKRIAVNATVPAAVAKPVIVGAKNVCASTDLRLSVSNAQNGVTYAWKSGSQTATGTGFSPSTTDAGSKTVTVTATGDSSATTEVSGPFKKGDTLYVANGGSGFKYDWKVNGQSAGTGSELVLADSVRSVSLTVTTSGTSSADASVVVDSLTKPTINFTINPSTVAYGASVPLAARATGSACTNPVTIRYSGQGVSGSTFDSRALTFDMSNRIKVQSKTVPVTATVTDSKNQTASAVANVTVTLQPAATHQDILFPARSARVNNVAKRYLLEQIAPQAKADPQAKVILVGHKEASEKLPKNLDDARTANSAAVLTAGKGVCANLDLSQVQVKSAGTDQAAEKKPLFGDASVKELAGQAVKQGTKGAEDRRVEVWFVPSGAEMPAGLTGLKSAVASKACPK
jgi:outer membrane protein OmpA-like peptidoglycan-associated protein